MASDPISQHQETLPLRQRRRRSPRRAVVALGASAPYTLAALGLALVTVVPGALKPARAEDEETPEQHAPAPAPVTPGREETPHALPGAPEGDGTAKPEPTADGAAAGAAGSAGKPDSGAAKGKGKPKKDQPQSYSGSSMEKYLGEWARELYFSGGSSLSSRSYAVDGSNEAQEAYRQQNSISGFGSTRRVGPFQQDMDLTIQGKVLDMFNVNARLSNNRFSSYANQTFGLDYDRKGTELHLGDVTASLPGNQFVNFSRSLRGLQFGRDLGGGMRLQGVTSLTRTTTRRGQFNGTGTSGPYSLNASMIIEGTETVRLNGRELARGQEYQLSPESGQIQFLGGLIINPSDTVEYTYEVQGLSQTPGLFTGMRWDQALGNGSTYGITFLQQTPMGGNSGSSERTVRFAIQPLPSGAGVDPQYQYYLEGQVEKNTVVEITYLAPTGPEVLREGTDYFLNKSIGFIRLLNTTRLLPDYSAGVPTGNMSLQVRYTPAVLVGVASKRSVFGFDTQTRLTNKIDLGIQYGQSQGSSARNNGSAMSLTANFKGNDKISGDLAWTDVGAGFSSLDSTSAAFLQIQKGLRGNLRYSPSPYVSIRSSMNQSRIVTEQTSSSTGTEDEDDTTTPSLTWNNNNTWNAAVSLMMPNWPRIDLSHNQTTQTNTASTTASKSTFASDQLNLNWQLGIFNFAGALGRTAARGNSVFGGYGGSLGNTSGGSVWDPYTGGSYSGGSNSSSNTARLQMSVAPASWISFNGAIGSSRTSYASTTRSSTRARDNSMGLTLTPLQTLQIGMNWIESSNGQSSTSGNGSQFDTSLGAQRVRTTALTANYTPFAALSLGLELSRSLSLVPGYDNTDNNTVQFTAAYQISPILVISGSISDQRTTYIGDQQGNSTNRSYLAQANIGPIGKMTFQASLQRFNTGNSIYYTGTDSSSTDYYGQQTDMTTYSLRGDYPIGGGRSLYMQWQTLDATSPSTTDSTGSSYGSNNYRRGTGTLGLSMNVNDLINFSLDANLIQMNDRAQSRYSYKAQALNMNLSTRF